VGSPAIEAICQVTETLFTMWQKSEAKPTAQAFDVLHRANETMRTLIARLDDPIQASTLSESIVEAVRALTNSEPPAPMEEREPETPVAESPAGEAPLADEAVPHITNETPVSPLPSDGHPVSPAPPEPAPPGERIIPAGAAAPLPEHLGDTGAPVAAAPQRTVLAEETVRITTNRLDELLLQAEELLTVKQSAVTRAAALHSLTETFRRWKEEWNKASHVLHLEEGLLVPGASVLPNSMAREDLRELREFFAWNRDYQRDMEERLRELARAAEQERRNVGGLIDSLLEQTKELLTLPFSHVLSTLPVVARDLSRQLGKNVRLEIVGEDTYLDKRILEELKDPLLHLLRNSVDHGIETPAIRRELGKPETATILLEAHASSGNEVEISISDDGRGLDPRAILSAAVQRNFVTGEEAARLGTSEIYDLIFQSAISTSQSVTTISGRGLGLAIVREKVEKLGGRVTVESDSGQGTTFHLTLPVTLATFRGVVVECRKHLFVVPIAGVDRVLRVDRDQIRTVSNRETILLSGRTGQDVLPLIPLSHSLELPGAEARGGEAPLPVLILRQGERRAALSVDEIHHEQEVLVKPLPRPLTRVRNISGTTVLEDGRAVPILSPQDLLTVAEKLNSKRASDLASGLPYEAESPTATEPKPATRSVLVVEDSVTSRLLLKNILETAGYAVVTAVDGADAVDRLQTTRFDVVVSDVDMPRLNGFQLTAHIRQTPAISALPVILVTSRDSIEDKTHGLEAGANAYIVKGSFDQGDLLQAIHRLV
jgi:two-component system chemotaxis sensor kinase CheA